MDLSSEIIEHIKRSAAQIKYGRIIIELNDTQGKIDVISECRKRFGDNKKIQNDFRGI